MMIGVCSRRFLRRRRAAVSYPSMSGMRTSSRMTAKSRSKAQRRASWPDWALTICGPRSRRMASKLRRLSSRSSTMRMASPADPGAWLMVFFDPSDSDFVVDPLPAVDGLVRGAVGRGEHVLLRPEPQESEGRQAFVDEVQDAGLQRVAEGRHHGPAQ